MRTPTKPGHAARVRWTKARREAARKIRRDLRRIRDEGDLVSVAERNDLRRRIRLYEEGRCP